MRSVPTRRSRCRYVSRASLPRRDGHRAGLRTRLDQRNTGRLYHEHRRDSRRHRPCRVEPSIQTAPWRSVRTSPGPVTSPRLPTTCCASWPTSSISSVVTSVSCSIAAIEPSSSKTFLRRSACSLQRAYPCSSCRKRRRYGSPTSTTRPWPSWSATPTRSTSPRPPSEAVMKSPGAQHRRRRQCLA